MKNSIIALSLLLAACDSGTTTSGSSSPSSQPISAHISVVTSADIDNALQCVSLNQWCKYNETSDCLTLKISDIEAARLDAFYSQYCAI